MPYTQRLSQLDKLPTLKNVELGSTIGQGSFAIVKVGQIKRNPQRLVAIKYIHRELSRSEGVDDERIGLEVRIHKECSGHPNVIGIHSFGTDNTWVYMVMELAQGGDLFDKIEPDIGIEEDLANFYFKQLINAVEYIHKKGVAHRDIKPENILLDIDGNLKLGDFGFATVYKRKNSFKRLSTEKCGSLPYMAPEIICLDEYDATLSDIWACGIVLFVLLTGQIAWQEPRYGTEKDFTRFVDLDGKVFDEPWNLLGSIVFPLLRSILKPDPSMRLTINQIRLHPWVNQENAFMNTEDLCADSEFLAERLLSRLSVKLSDNDVENTFTETANDMIKKSRRYISNSQPANDIAAMINDLDDYKAYDFPATQDQNTFKNNRIPSYDSNDAQERILAIVSKDPTILQFRDTDNKNNSQLTSTQKFMEESKNLQLGGATRMTRFFSILPIESLISIIQDSLHRIAVSTTNIDDFNGDMDDLYGLEKFYININLLSESSKMQLKGYIIISKCDKTLPLRKVEFVKSKGDPLEWRKFFKKVTILSREAVYLD